jgi:HlyD family secretion protein
VAFKIFSPSNSPEPQSFTPPELEREPQPSTPPELERSSAEGTVLPDRGGTPSRGWLSGGRGMLIGLGLGMAIAAGGMTLAGRSGKEPAAPAVQKATVAGQTVSVEAAKLTSVTQTFPVQGTVQARNWVSVIPKAAGVQIQEVRVNEGQRVEAGQVIAVLDNSVQQERLNQANAQVSSSQAQVQSAETQLEGARAQLQTAQAQLASAQAGVEQKRAQLRQQQASSNEAKSNRNRYNDLANQGVVSRQEAESRNTSAITAQEGVRVAETNITSAEADVGRARADVSKAQAGVNQAQAGVNQARADLQNAIARVQEQKTQLQQSSIVQAPASGIIAKKNVSVGDQTGKDPLFAIIQDGAVELQAKVPENLLSKVREGATAQVTSDADKRINVQGRVREVNPIVDEKTRQATVKIDLPANALLKPGMFLKAALSFDTAQALTVPTEAVLSQADGQKIVYIIDGDKTVQSRVVQVGEPSEGRLVVKDGLKPGDQIVVAGAGFLKDGDPVTIVK